MLCLRFNNLTESMRLLARHLLTLLLAIALPIMGWASVALPAAQPCPMQAMMQAGDHADCCADKATLGKTGQPCKMGQECQSGAHALPDVVVSFVPVLNASPRVTLPEPFLAHSGPAGVWRPPRLV